MGYGIKQYFLYFQDSIELAQSRIFWCACYAILRTLLWATKMLHRGGISIVTLGLVECILRIFVCYICITLWYIYPESRKRIDLTRNLILQIAIVLFQRAFRRAFWRAFRRACGILELYHTNICMYVCMYVCMYIHINIQIHIQNI